MSLRPTTWRRWPPAPAGGGAIVNVSSEASLRGSAAGVAYTAAKHAVNGLTKSTAFFYKGQGIRANAVVPGGVITNIEAAFRSEQAAAIVGPVRQATLPSVGSPVLLRSGNAYPSRI